jgi:hypothetical protein
VNGNEQGASPAAHKSAELSTTEKEHNFTGGLGGAALNITTANRSTASPSR